VLLISSPRFEDHIPPPGHPERPERAQVFDTVASRHLQKGGRILQPRQATRQELELAHTPAHIDALERTGGRAVMLDPDTFTSADSDSVARLAAGAAIQAVEQAIEQREPTFALVRPPGHHAERDRAMGFCLFNNAAVAAAAARARGTERVAIVDVDVHHGNGTQHTFYEDPSVLYISTHQFPFYPGTGAASETGRGAGAGFTVNIPLEAGATDEDYALVHRAIVLPVLEEFRPQVTIVSAGYDAHEQDPLASMRMTAGGYAYILRGLAAVVARHGALACLTEGGYDLRALASCLEASFAAIDEGFGGEIPAPTSEAVNAPNPVSTARADRTIQAVRAAQKPFWRI
jgi:acetoin utilization deacetylase AcuC-like enzyme